MAKSLRAKSKQANKRAKRTDPKSPFRQQEALRVARLADKLKESANKPKQREIEAAEKAEEEGEEAEGAEMVVEKGDEVEEDAEAKQVKVSTHGPRMSGREVWKAHKKGKEASLTDRSASRCSLARHLRCHGPSATEDGHLGQEGHGRQASPATIAASSCGVSAVSAVFYVSSIALQQ